MQFSKIRSVFGYIWAGLAFFIVLATFLGHDALSKKLALGTGITVSPRYTGGEAIRTIEHGSYRTIIHRPVFDGLLSDRRQGFIQINWESGSALPPVIEEHISSGKEKRMDFTIRLDTAKGRAIITTGGSSVVGVDKCIRLNNGWAVRVLLIKEG